MSREGRVGQAVKVFERNPAVAFSVVHRDNRFMHGHRYRHVRRVNGNASAWRLCSFVGLTEDCVHTVEALDCGAARARVALVASVGWHAQVGATRALKKISGQRVGLADC